MSDGYKEVHKDSAKANSYWYPINSALDKLLGQLGIYAIWLSSIAYLQKQLRIFIFFIPRHTLVARYYVIPFGVCPSVLTISDR